MTETSYRAQRLGARTEVVRLVTPEAAPVPLAHQPHLSPFREVAPYDWGMEGERDGAHHLALAILADAAGEESALHLAAPFVRHVLDHAPVGGWRLTSARVVKWSALWLENMRDRTDGRGLPRLLCATEGCGKPMQVRAVEPPSDGRRRVLRFCTSCRALWRDSLDGSPLAPVDAPLGQVVVDEAGDVDFSHLAALVAAMRDAPPTPARPDRSTSAMGLFLFSGYTGGAL